VQVLDPDRERLSRYLSYLLRHSPDSIRLTLDEDGFIPLQRLISAIGRRNGWNWVTLDDIAEIQRSSQKKRFEIAEGRIRALYGHTLTSRIHYDSVVPPQILFHGTSRKNLESILKRGIMPMHRQYVHLSTSAEDAKSVGLRRDEDPVIIKVLALQAHKNGVKFFKAGAVFLSEPIPPRFLELKD
jgi:putative RNA 2'-phosphotransferase